MWVGSGVRRAMSAARSSLSSSCPWSRSSGSSASRSTAAEPMPSGATSRRGGSRRPRRRERLPAEQQLDPGDHARPDDRRVEQLHERWLDVASASRSTRATASPSGDDPVAAPELVPRRARDDARPVTTSATALAGFPDTRPGLRRSSSRSVRSTTTGRPSTRRRPTSARGTATCLTSELDIAWTNSGTGNVNTSEVSEHHLGAEVVNKTLDYGEYIGQHNNGNHTALYGDVDTYLSGKDMPVAIVDASGNFMGWATFHVNSASGGLEQAHQRLLPELVRRAPRRRSRPARTTPAPAIWAPTS